MAMEFWGAEVKSGTPLKVKTGEGMVIHLSQASVGEAKKEKASDAICLFVSVDGKKLVLATLFSDKLPQQQFDLVFDRDFELSHNWKAGSVFFYGYKAPNPFEDNPEDFDSDSFTDDDSSDSEEDPPLLLDNGKSETAVKEEKSETKAKEEKPAAIEKAKAGKNSAAGKQKVKIVEPSKDDDSEDESDDDMDSDDMDEDEDDSEEDEESEDEETPTPKVQTGKKRAAAESASKTPVPDKKAKLTTPQKTDGKKGGGHVATPHPAKQAGKTPANKSDQKTPKSAGSFPCPPCKKTFTSETALQSHSKAKHSGGK